MTLSTWPRRLRDSARRLSECVKSDWLLACQMAALRVSLPVLKRLFKVATLAQYLWSPPATRFSVAERRERVELITAFVRKGGRLLVSGNCLDRSLTLFAVLSRSDADPTLVLGARQGETGMAGHAWIELQGTSPFDSEVDQYTPVVAFNGRTPGNVHLQSVI
jgi:hypothetical protein